MRYRGHIDALRNQVVDGWAVDLQSPERPVTVELLVDGQAVAETTANRLRPDLRDAKIGTGLHGFMIAIPDAAFDGRSHAVGARIKDARHLLVGAREALRLDAARRPAFEGALTGVGNGIQLRGWLRNTAVEAEPVLVDLVLDDVVIAHALAADASPPGVMAPGCGFSFNLAAAWRPDLLSGALECRVAGTGLAYPARDALRRAITAEQVRLLDDGLEGVVRLPAFLPANCEIELWLNEARLENVTWQATRAEHGDVLRRFSIALSAAQSATAPSLEIRLPQLGYSIGGGARRIMPLTPHNLVRNGLFQSWLGDRPRHWSIDEQAIGRLVPEHCRLDMSDAELPLFGPVALRFELGDAAADGAGDGLDAADGAASPLLSQRLEAWQLPPGEAVKWVLVARSSLRLAASLVLDLEDADGAPLQARSPLRLGPRWALLGAELLLPTADQPFRAASLSLEVPAGPAVVHVAAIGLGLNGFTLEPEAEVLTPETLADGVPAPDNAVANGRFEIWSRGLAFTASKRRMETADGWWFYSKTVQPTVSIGVEKLLTRDPARVEPSREVFALGVRGEVGAPCRLEALLDPLSLGAWPPGRLGFYASRKPRASGPAAAEAAQARLINRILLVRRAAPAGDEVLCTIARNIGLSPGGRYHEFRIPAFNLDWPSLLARFHLNSGEDCQFFLRFEFEPGTLDCVLAEVELGPRRDREAVAGEPGFVGLEDANIGNQLDALKGLAHWASARTIPAPLEPASAALPDAVTRWTQPHAGFPSVEIVIPVFNAREETAACLRSIERNTSLPHLLTLIDDASDPPTALLLAAFAEHRPWVRLVRNDSNLGYTRSSNLGLARSTADWVVLLNSDTVVAPRWLEGLFECALSDPKIRFVGPLSNAASWQSVPELFDARGKFKVNALPAGCSVDAFALLVEQHSLRAFPRVPLLNGFCTMMERRALEALGYLDEIAFPVGYGEENDLCLRAVKAGFELAIADHVYVHHIKSASFGTARRDDLARQGNQQLLLKHPDVDLDQAQKQLSELPSLVTLRQALAGRLGPDSHLQH